MNRTRIKICGVTRFEDACAAADAGADAIGIVLQPGARRFVGNADARVIVRMLPPFVTPVAVVVDAPDPADSARCIGASHVQLNGNEAPDDVKRIRGAHVIKALRLTADDVSEQLLAWQIGIVEAIVLEPSHTAVPGGSGIENDWALIADARKRGLFDGASRLIVAGGLTPENVGDVVRSIRPWAVDVSSGVESSVGVKSIEKIRAFISAVRAADEDV